MSDPIFTCEEGRITGNGMGSFWGRWVGPGDFKESWHAYWLQWDYDPLKSPSDLPPSSQPPSPSPPL